MTKIKIAIAGIGNCASSLIQGIEYYTAERKDSIGLMHLDLGGINPRISKLLLPLTLTPGKKEKM